MQTYEIELASSDTQQARITSLEAPDEATARKLVTASEEDITRFSMLPPSRDEWEQGTYIVHTQDGEKTHARVNLANWDAYHPKFAEHAAGLSYQDAVQAAKWRLDDFHSRVEIAGDGSVRYANLNARLLSRLIAHRQTEPGTITDVRVIDPVEIEVQRLVRQAKALHESDPRKLSLAIRRLREQGIPVNAVTAFLYGLPWQKQIDGSSVTVHSSATIQCSLHTAYTGNQDTDDFQNDISGTEVTGTAYVANGVTLASKTTNYNTSTNLIWLDAADPQWTASTISATDAVFWVNTAGAATTDPLWGNVDFGATVATTAGTFQITLDATGYIAFNIT